MSLTDFKIQNYRSVKNVWLRLSPVNVFVGANGCGKSNLYRALYLLASTATGRFARAIAEEGGISSAIWCGRFGHKEARQIVISTRLDALQYDLSCGFVRETMRNRQSLFCRDIEIKYEKLSRLKGGSQTKLLDRRVAAVTARNASGDWSDYTMRLSTNESIITGVRDPERFPELSQLRMELLNWRFYHHFRTDKHSPLRRPHYAVQTDIMADDGSDFVAALATILEVGDEGGLLDALQDAFPGSSLIIDPINSWQLKLKMRMPGFSRPFEAFELSCGTLQYLCLLAAVYSRRPPALLAINEPEMSIHPELYEPLARLLASCSARTQVWVTTHSHKLATYIEEFSGYPPQELEKVDGETRLVGAGLGGYREDPFEEDSDD